MSKKLTRRDEDRLDEIQELIDDDMLHEALSEAMEFTQSRPRVVEGWQTLAYIAHELDVPFAVWQSQRRLAKLDPQDDGYAYNLIVTALQFGNPFQAKQAVKDYLQRHPYGSKSKLVYDMQELIDKSIDELIESGEIPADVDMDAMALFETGQLLISHSEVAEGRRLTQQAIKRLPQNPAPKNNLALSYTIEGQFTRALEICDEVLEDFPDNAHAWGNKIQTLVKLGRWDEASGCLDHVLTLSSDNPDHWFKIAEACAYLQQHQAIIDIYDKLKADRKRSQDDTMPPLMTHLAATAHAYLGDEKKAKKLWREVVKQFPSFSPAHDNLSVFNEFGPYYFEFTNWIPIKWVHEVERILSTSARKSEDRIARDIIRSFEKQEGAEAVTSLLLRYGGPNGVQFALDVAHFYPLPGLDEFALSERGTLQDRLQAAQLAAKHGQIDVSQPIKVFDKGEVKEIQLLTYEIDFEPTPDPSLSEAAQNHLEAAHNAISYDDVETSLMEADKGLALAPDHPTLLNNKASALRKAGRHDEADAIFQHLNEIHPDYFFGKLGMADIATRAGRLDEAAEWLKPLMQQTHFHISEFRGLALMYIQYWRKKEDFTSAQYWIQMLDDIDPDIVPMEWRVQGDLLNTLKRMLDKMK